MGIAEDDRASRTNQKNIPHNVVPFYIKRNFVILLVACLSVRRYLLREDGEQIFSGHRLLPVASGAPSESCFISVLVYCDANQSFRDTILI